MRDIAVRDPFGSGRKARLVLPLAVATGLALPGLAALAAPAVPLLVLALLIQTMVRLELPALRATLRSPRQPLLAVAVLLGLLPAAVAGVAAALALPADLATVLTLGAAMPPLLSTAALARLLGLDAALALVVTIAATFAVPLTLPAVAAVLTAAPLQVAPGTLFLRLAAVIATAAVAAAALRRLMGTDRLERAAPRLDDAGLVILFLFGVAVMDGLTATLLAEPAAVLRMTAAVFGLNFGLQAAAYLLFRRLGRLGRRPALTLAFAGGFRNVALLLAALPPPVDPVLVLFVAVTQFPIYLLPGLLFGVYRRWAEPGGSEEDGCTGREA